ncbi:hypothetical protein BV898_19044 [Hypsibius exemplaris]|uniref:Uncharacterized protein n=1 Tax=Hypsibius exemplaris TaxID=2072580 RepID=A0A9X6NHZ4_HYPEX|nr:hypothetical protein BV898_19044 [Hypsibius exemplaris]
MDKVDFNKWHQGASSAISRSANPVHSHGVGCSDWDPRFGPIPGAREDLHFSFFCRPRRPRPPTLPKQTDRVCQYHQQLQTARMGENPDQFWQQELDRLRDMAAAAQSKSLLADQENQKLRFNLTVAQRKIADYENRLTAGLAPPGIPQPTPGLADELTACRREVVMLTVDKTRLSQQLSTQTTACEELQNRLAQRVKDDGRARDLMTEQDKTIAKLQNDLTKAEEVTAERERQWEEIRNTLDQQIRTLVPRNTDLEQQVRNLNGVINATLGGVWKEVRRVHPKVPQHLELLSGITIDYVRAAVDLAETINASKLDVKPAIDTKPKQITGPSPGGSGSGGQPGTQQELKQKALPPPSPPPLTSSTPKQDNKGAAGGPTSSQTVGKDFLVTPTPVTSKLQRVTQRMLPGTLTSASRSEGSVDRGAPLPQHKGMPELEPIGDMIFPNDDDPWLVVAKQLRMIRVLFNSDPKFQKYCLGQPRNTLAGSIPYFQPHCGAYAFTLLYNDVKSVFDGHKANRYSIVKRHRELSTPMLDGRPNKEQIRFVRAVTYIGTHLQNVGPRPTRSSFTEQVSQRQDAVIMLAKMAETVAVWLQLFGKQAVLDIELIIKACQYVASDAATEMKPPPIPEEVFQRNPTQADVEQFNLQGGTTKEYLPLLTFKQPSMEEIGHYFKFWGEVIHAILEHGVPRDKKAVSTDLRINRYNRNRSDLAKSRDNPINHQQSICRMLNMPELAKTLRPAKADYQPIKYEPWTDIPEMENWATGSANDHDDQDDDDDEVHQSEAGDDTRAAGDDDDTSNASDRSQRPRLDAGGRIRRQQETPTYVFPELVIKDSSSDEEGELEDQDTSSSDESAKSIKPKGTAVKSKRKKVAHPDSVLSEPMKKRVSAYNTTGRSRPKKLKAPKSSGEEEQPQTTSGKSKRTTREHSGEPAAPSWVTAVVPRSSTGGRVITQYIHSDELFGDHEGLTEAQRRLLAVQQGAVAIKTQPEPKRPKTTVVTVPPPPPAALQALRLTPDREVLNRMVEQQTKERSGGIIPAPPPTDQPLVTGLFSLRPTSAAPTPSTSTATPVMSPMLPRLPSLMQALSASGSYIPLPSARELVKGMNSPTPMLFDPALHEEQERLGRTRRARPEALDHGCTGATPEPTTAESAKSLQTTLNAPEPLTSPTRPANARDESRHPSQELETGEPSSSMVRSVMDDNEMLHMPQFMPEDLFGWMNQPLLDVDNEKEVGELVDMES